MSENKWKSAGSTISGKEKKFLKWAEIEDGFELTGIYKGREEAPSKKFEGTLMYTFMIETKEMIYGLPSFSMLAKKMASVEVGNAVMFEFVEKHPRGYRCNVNFSNDEESIKELT